LQVRGAKRNPFSATVINSITFDGATKDAMQCAVRDALIAFMAATAQAQAEATEEAQRAGIAHAKANGDARAYKGRKPSYSRKQLESAQAMLGKSSSVGEVARTSAVAEFSNKFGAGDPAMFAFTATAAGTLQLVFDLGVRARDHDFLQRRYYQLIAEMKRVAAPSHENICEWEAIMYEIYAEEPPPMRALDSIAWNAACESMGGDKRIKVTWYQSLLRNIWAFNGSEFPYERPAASAKSI
jgi:hypothetical protein